MVVSAGGDLTHLHHADSGLAGNGRFVRVGFGKHLLDLVEGFLIHGNRLSSSRWRGRGEFVLESRCGERGQCLNEVIGVLERGTELLVYQVVQVGKKGGVLFLGFSFGNFGFRSLLNFLQNLFGIFAEVDVKGYLCHSLWDNECLG